MHTFTFLFILALAASVSLQWYLIRRQIKHVNNNRNQVPPAFTEKISLSEHRKAADYTIAKSHAGLVESVISAVLLLVWTLFGALQQLDNFWSSLELSLIWTGTGFILSVVLISAVLDLPMSVYQTFKLEQKFGFNKTTAKTFMLDLIKHALLMSAIGIPFVSLVLWLMENAGSLWWLYVWFTWFGFSLFMMWAYPAFIAPLFNKFRPLEQMDLKQRIENLLQRNGFAAQGIFVMNGSIRSTHGNAYFTGLGTSKRIVFYDTLINDLSDEEIEAVLAHELGHFKHNHIKKRIFMTAAISLLGLALLGWIIEMPWFYQGLGVTSRTTYMALTLFIMIFPVFSFFLQPVFAWISRQHEFEADKFAAGQTQADKLVQALVKLYRENANTLTPDPLYSAFHDSHPPAPIRIAHLQGKS
jgi:STE24 endopeptidase